MRWFCETEQGGRRQLRAGDHPSPAVSGGLQRIKNGSGSIVNVSSTWRLNAYPNRSSYISSKHAVCGLTKTAALELAQKNIRVNAVTPGPIMTPLLVRDWQGDISKAADGVPMGRVGRPEEVAEAVVWLCSERASFITGHILPIDGGMLCGTFRE